MRNERTDVLILGSGGAGLLAALHAHDANPELDITVAVKGLLGKCGCTRMVQGGYNVALAPGDSPERHFMDTIEGGKWLSDQALAWTLVTGAVERVRELENEIGCFFDRNRDGTLHQKAFAGQTFDRTVHKGDLTGIEIINRLAEQVWARKIGRLEEHRAVALIPDSSGARIAGVLLLDVRSGELLFVQARAVLLATGGGPTMYRYHTPSGDKSCDGLAMALRAGLAVRDMEMVQFHPTGLLAGDHTRMTGTVLEEGLRGAGGYLLNGQMERFMHRYDPRAERATRDIVSRAIFTEVQEGRGSEGGGVYISMAHLDTAEVERRFKGMVERCRDCGFDLVNEPVEVTPTAHYMMGGVVFRPDCTTGLAGLYAAGEDTGGVHGANRLGGNGVANSTVFGGIAGETMASEISDGVEFVQPDGDVLAQASARVMRPLDQPAGDLSEIRRELDGLMWLHVGIVRDGPGLEQAEDRLLELQRRLDRVGVNGGDRRFNLGWQDWLNLDSLILVGRVICASALARADSTGAHYRSDFPQGGRPDDTFFTTARLDSIGATLVANRPVEFSMVSPGGSLLAPSESSPPGS
ncbi:MAG: FAD-binding protein [Trueperaceae bacterium]